MGVLLPKVETGVGPLFSLTEEPAWAFGSIELTMAFSGQVAKNAGK
jgi:hypothetical protein